MVKFSISFLTFWTTAGGFLHLVENTGDFWISSVHNRDPPFRIWDAMYLVIVTVSTVGFGDITVATRTGQFALISYIVTGIIYFTTVVPDLVDIWLHMRNPYGGDYQRSKKHLVICGNITRKSLTGFLVDFFHQDRVKSKIRGVFGSACVLVGIF